MTQPSRIVPKDNLGAIFIMLRIRLMCKTTDQQLFFVVGASWSGTTRSRVVRRANNRIAGHEELQFLGEFPQPRQMKRRVANQRSAATIVAAKEPGACSSSSTGGNTIEAQNSVRRLRRDEPRSSRLYATLAGDPVAGQRNPIPCKRNPTNLCCTGVLTLNQNRARMRLSAAMVSPNTASDSKRPSPDIVPREQ